MDQHPLHQAILSLSRDHQLPEDKLQTMTASDKLDQVLSDAHLLRSLLLGYTERVIALETKIADDAAKVAFYDAITDASNTQSIQEVGKILGIGPAKFFDWLRRTGILLPDNLPYQCHIDAGYFKVIQSNWTDKNGQRRLYARSVVTGKGVAYLQKCFQNARPVPVVAGFATAATQEMPSLFPADNTRHGMCVSRQTA